MSQLTIKELKALNLSDDKILKVLSEKDDKNKKKNFMFVSNVELTLRNLMGVLILIVYSLLFFSAIVSLSIMTFIVSEFIGISLPAIVTIIVMEIALMMIMFLDISTNYLKYVTEEEKKIEYSMKNYDKKSKGGKK